MTSSSAQRLPILAGFLILWIFLFLRPVTVSFHHIGSISLLDMFGIASSFLILVGIVINLGKLRLDTLSLAILFFVFYCMASMLWGSDYKDVAKAVFPFLPFFLAKTIGDGRNSPALLWALALGYILPVCGSTAMILLGLSETMVTGSMVERQAGLSSGVHTLGHLMLFFSFVFALFLLAEPGKKMRKAVMFILFLGSLFCIYKSYTRTAILGGMVFWFSHLFFWKRKLFFITLFICMLGAVWQFDNIKSIVTQENAVSNRGPGNTVDLNTAGSGRIRIWQHNLSLFSELSLTRQLLGVGFGKELETIPGTRSRKWMGSHNDYMSLAITGGVLGLMIYLLIYTVLFFIFVSAPVPGSLKSFSLAMLAAVLVMNLVSNSYIVRFQMAQLFWFLAGLLYGHIRAVRQEKAARPVSVQEAPDAG